MKNVYIGKGFCHVLAQNTVMYFLPFTTKMSSLKSTLKRVKIFMFGNFRQKGQK